MSGLIAKGIKMKLKYTVPYIIGGIIALNIMSNTERTSAAMVNKKLYRMDSTTGKNNIHKDVKADTDTTVADIDWSAMTPQAMRAVERRKDVLYIMNNGDTIRRSGGTRAWRNMNPGCLRYADFAKDNGAIGKCGGFAVFPDEQTGRAALVALLRTDRYNKLSIARAISKYAPPHENDVSLYRRKLKKLTGLSLETKLYRLDSMAIEKVADAICMIEGWCAGKVDHIIGQNTILAQTRKHQLQDSMQHAL